MCSLEKILLVRASGGLSNRLQAVICAIAYCLLSHRVLCVDWRDGLYSDDFSNVFPLWFDIKGLQQISYEKMLIQFNNSPSINPPFWKDWLSDAAAVEYLFNGNEHMRPENTKKTRIYLENTNIKQDIAVFWSWDTSPIKPLIPLLQNKFPHLAGLSQLEIERYLLKSFITPRSSLLLEANNFFDTYFNEAPIGIHIRHTDLQSPLNNMLQLLENLVEQNQSIFLCTDNEQVEKMVKRIFPQTITRKKIYQGPNTPLHSYVEGISNVQKGHDALLDMLLLARCKSIIHYYRSSFAHIPILLSGLKEECVYKVTD